MLLPGDWVEVLSAVEIVKTLDQDGCLEGLPFMPEMAAHCGRRFMVHVRAERTCIMPEERTHRRLERAVVLKQLRCDGSLHDGCQLGCMMVWKESWLRRVDGPIADQRPAGTEPRPEFKTHRGDDVSLYQCQATELVRATEPGPPRWSPPQYLRLLRVRTLGPGEFVRMFGGIALRKLWKLVGRPRGSAGTNNGDVPKAPLGLKPGDLVTVKSRDGINATLDARGTLRGLMFAETMYAYCGKTLKVVSRVERVIDERTGKMRHFAPGTVLLERAVCDRYRGCARNLPIMWREAWLERVGASSNETAASRPVLESTGSTSVGRGSP